MKASFLLEQREKNCVVLFTGKKKRTAIGGH
jgi:hypothetical protein